MVKNLSHVCTVKRSIQMTKGNFCFYKKTKAVFSFKGTKYHCGLWNIQALIIDLKVEILTALAKLSACDR